MCNQSASFFFQERHCFSGPGRCLHNSLGNIFWSGKRPTNVYSRLGSLDWSETSCIGEAILVQLNTKLIPQFTHCRRRPKPGGKDNHAKVFCSDVSIVLLVGDLQVPGRGDFLDGGGTAANIPDTELFGTLIIGIKAFAECTHINVKYRAVEVGLVLLSNNSFLGCVHTADGRAIVAVHFSRSDALNPCYLLGMFLVGRPKNLAEIRPAGREKTLKLQA